MAAIPFARICRMVNGLWLPRPLPQMLELLAHDAEVEFVLVCMRVSCWFGENQQWVACFRGGTGQTWSVDGKYRGLSTCPRGHGRTDVHDLSADVLSTLRASLKASNLWNLPQRLKGSRAIDADDVIVLCADRKHSHRVACDDTGASHLSPLLNVLHQMP
jgi:hypothetical protein